jgi:hypothetical protein
MACSTNGETRNGYRLLVGKLEGKRPLRRPRRMWVDNNKLYLKRDMMGWYGLKRDMMGWYGLDQSGSG